MPPNNCADLGGNPQRYPRGIARPHITHQNRLPGILTMAGRRTEHRSIASYDRGRDLRALLPVRTVDLTAEGLTAQARLVARLRQALRLERRRGLAGSWSYHPGRHASLLQAYREERTSLERARQRRPREA